MELVSSREFGAMQYPHRTPLAKVLLVVVVVSGSVIYISARPPHRHTTPLHHTPLKRDYTLKELFMTAS